MNNDPAEPIDGILNAVDRHHLRLESKEKFRIKVEKRKSTLTYEKFSALPESVKEAMRWAKEKQEDYEEKDWDKLTKTIGDLLSMANEPVWSRAEGEGDYRRGFMHGMDYATDLIRKLERVGFIRKKEICNIMDDFVYKVLLPWKLKAFTDAQSENFQTHAGHPSLKHESWPAIRKRIMERDRYCCVNCGQTENLHVDHIHPVVAGGLPTDTNLQTLCSVCNQRKGGKTD